MRYRIERDDSSSRGAFENYSYRIYNGDELVALYWHDFRGDSHGVRFSNGHTEENPIGAVSDFLEGGGPLPLTLSPLAMQYLKNQVSNTSLD